MRLAEYRREQDAITAPVVTAAVSVLRSLAGRPLTGDLWRLLLGALFPTVAQARAGSVDLAVRFYAESRAEYATGPAPVPQPPRYELAALDRGLTRTARSRLAEPLTARAAISDTAGMLARHVEQAGRDTVAAVTDLDPVALGWARVPTGRETCAFCWMLASRGPVYGGTESTGEMTDWHDRCDCQVTPVFDAATWDGRARYLAAHQVWTDVTAGHSGRDALNAFRRALNDPAVLGRLRAA